MQKLFAEMREQALTRGKEALQSEDKLEQMFRENRPEAELREQVLRIASLRAELRWVHLQAHLSAAKVLTPEQIALYSQFRQAGNHNKADKHPHENEESGSVTRHP